MASRSPLSSSARRPLPFRSFAFLVLSLLLCRDDTFMFSTDLMIVDAFPSLTVVTSLMTRHTSSCNSLHKSITSHGTRLLMARPGQSEAQARQEREEEIRVQLARLKSAGKLKNGRGDKTMMQEAEDFFNQESPTRKFERIVKARKDAAEEAAAVAAKEEKDIDEQDDSTCS